MGILFEMENDIVDVKGKYKVRGRGNPIDFKVFLIEKDEPYMPSSDMYGFRPEDAYMANGSIELFATTYDIIVRIDKVTMRMPFQEFRNLSSLLERTSDSLSREIRLSKTNSDASRIATTITNMALNS